VRRQSAIDAQNRRLATSGKLDTFMMILKETCPACFVCFGQLVKHPAFQGCSEQMTIPQTGWVSLKRQFKFIPYTYCFNCGLPQDRGPIKESPDCHRGLTWGKGIFCPWADYVFIVIWSIWHVSERRATFLSHHNLDGDISYEDFLLWAMEEDALSGEYYKALEGFVWFCEQWMASWRRINPRV